ncbi:MAG: hypothetical protein IKU84_06510 [Clostridia bacterium]|nr:hypothetical protein [Clostridia bacterium]
MRIKAHFSKSTINFIVLSIFLLCGIIVGAVTASYIEGDTISDLSKSISGIVNSDHSKILIKTVFSVFKYPLFVFLCGFTALGVLFLPIVIYVKGYYCAFSIGAIIRIYGTAGIWISFSVFAVQAIVLIPCLLLISALSFNSAKQQWRMFITGKHSVFEPILTKQHIFTVTFCFICLLFLSAFEVFITPNLVSYALKNII